MEVVILFRDSPNLMCQYIGVFSTKDLAVQYVKNTFSAELGVPNRGDVYFTETVVVDEFVKE